jgi:hypothetical protein
METAAFLVVLVTTGDGQGIPATMKQMWQIIPVKETALVMMQQIFVLLKDKDLQH